MFEAEEIEKLSSFMNVPTNLGMSKKYVNKTKGTPESHGNLELEIKRAYSEVYDFCFENYPQTRGLWRKAS